jgi:hypothetical protein
MDKEIVLHLKKKLKIRKFMNKFLIYKMLNKKIIANKREYIKVKRIKSWDLDYMRDMKIWGINKDIYK